MGVKVSVLYDQPTDPAAFEAYYLSTHVPLVNKIPGLDGFEYGKVLPSIDGSPQELFWIATLSFASMEAMGAGMMSPEGVATAEDVPNFATGPVKIVMSEVL